ncbi:hypothetical protein OIDMADRAFT_31330 [Oidiodendron maius Zn]|uniref:Uncharacterized protein n=1 Tax=Oidiodendron maius (strain Zn) TaxID=913774 RepID=A0A0C3H805_OIDMZ|nr:hypothetical protein OIDMADRAFT_31330 [Oidiodendron maius Zn]
MFKSTVALILAVSLPFCSAVPAENAVHPKVERAVTHDPAAAIWFYPAGATTCDDPPAGIQVPDGVCFDIYESGVGALWISAFDTGCTLEVYSESGCTGSDSATLGTTDKCWQVALRNSFQVFCST